MTAVLPMFWCAWCREPIHKLTGIVIRQGQAYCCDPCHRSAHPDATPPEKDRTP